MYAGGIGMIVARPCCRVGAPVGSDAGRVIGGEMSPYLCSYYDGVKCKFILSICIYVSLLCISM